MTDAGYFTREFLVDGICEPLVFVQKAMGDVSCVIWDAALALAKYLEVEVKRGNSFEARNVLELGAGVGCVGLTTACFG